MRVLLYVHDILLCLPGSRARHVEDLRSLLYVLNVFGYFSGLRVKFEKTMAAVKTQSGSPQPSQVAGIQVKPYFKYLGVLLGNLTPEAAWGPTVGKLVARAKTIAFLSLSLQERAYLFSASVAPVAYLIARAYEAPKSVRSQLNVVQWVPLGLNSWHLTVKILAMPEREGGIAHASPSSYVTWVHSQTVVLAAVAGLGQVRRGGTEPTDPALSAALTSSDLKEADVSPRGAEGLLPNPEVGGGSPEHLIRGMGIWHNLFFRNAKQLTYACPRLVRKSVLTWGGCDARTFLNGVRFG